MVKQVQFERPIRVVDDGGSNQANFVESTNGNFLQVRLGQHITFETYRVVKEATSSKILLLAELNYDTKFSKGGCYIFRNQNYTQLLIIL